MAASSSTPATTSASSTSTSSSPRGRGTRPTAPPTGTCWTRARSTSPASTRTARSRWLPLVHGQGPLTAANGFASQADVVIKARRAGDLLKATPMDRPEDIETNPVNGRVYVVLTNNSSAQARRRSTRPIRAPTTTTAISSSSRPKDGDHASTEGDLVDLPAGRQARPGRRRALSPCDVGQGLARLPRQHRLRFQGPHLDRHRRRAEAAGVADGVYAADTMGPAAALTRCFYQAPTGAEMCGPIFTPDDRPSSSPCSIPARMRLDFREALDALARLQGRHAAAAFGGGDHQEGRRRRSGRRSSAVDDGDRIHLEQPARLDQAGHEDERADRRSGRVDVAVADLLEGGALLGRDRRRRSSC